MEALVTYELVVNAAENLLATDKKLTVANIREALGNIGSTQTIHKYYKLYKQEKFLEELDPKKLPARIQNLLQEKLQSRVEDQDFILEKSRERNSDLEQKLDLEKGKNTKLQDRMFVLESGLKDNLYTTEKKNSEIEKLEAILSEVKFQHQSHIRFLESSLEKVTSMHKSSTEDWRDRHNALYEKHQSEIIDYQNQVERLKQSSEKGTGEKAFALDNLIRHVGELKRELDEKNKVILELKVST